MISKEELKELLYYANLNFERENERKTEFSNKIEKSGVADNEESFKIIEKDLDLLEEYRKIEEELGIDLITLFNIDKQLNTKKEIWFKIEDEIDASYRYDGDYYIIDLKHKAFVKMVCEPIDYFYFKDYGKTWALTKEELENDN